MKNSKTIFRFALIFGMLFLMLSCTSCTQSDVRKVPKAEDYFSVMDIQNWKLDNLGNQYTMNGGYILCFQGEYYPIEFHYGEIVSELPEEMFFLNMNSFYTNPNCSPESCYAYLGSREEFKLLQPNVQHRGYVLDKGKNPRIGSVLYVDETDERTLEIAGEVFGPDDVLFLKEDSAQDDGMTNIAYTYYVENGNTADLYCLFYSDEDGVFAEDVNTMRKLYTYAKNNNIVFDQRVPYTTLTFPSAFLNPANSNALVYYASLRYSKISFESFYDVFLHYENENFENKCYRVFRNQDEMNRLLKNIESDSNYTDIVKDDNGQIVSFFSVKYGKTLEVVRSLEAFNQILDEQCYHLGIDQNTIGHFSTAKQGSAFDGYLEYCIYSDSRLNRLDLYAVWETAESVYLQIGDEIEKIYLNPNKATILNEPVCPGYTFEGWYTDENYSGLPITEISFEDGYDTLYAKLKKVDYYTLSFEQQGTQALEDLRYSYGEEITLPVVSKPFHTFKGWCKDPACMDKPITEITSEFFGDYHLYPCFEPMVQTVTFVVNGKAEKITVRYGEEFSLPLPEESADQFIGYYDIEGVQYTDALGKSLNPLTEGADIQLFAHFQ